MHSPSCRLLVVVAYGLGRDEVASLGEWHRIDSLFLLPLERLECAPLADPAALLAGDALTAALRALGTSVDRSSVVLRPRWRSDSGVLAGLLRRPFGPAQITVLALRDVVHAARRHGPGSAAHRSALRQLAAHLGGACQVLTTRGRPPDLCLLATGALVPASCQVDPRPRLPRPARAWLRRHADAWRPEVLTLEARAGLEAVLRGGELLRHGRVLSPGEARALGLSPTAGRICYAAKPGTAFGTARGVVPWHDGAGQPAVYLPWRASSRGPLTVEDVAARLLQRAAELAPVEAEEMELERDVVATDSVPGLCSAAAPEHEEPTLAVGQGRGGDAGLD